MSGVLTVLMSIVPELPALINAIKALRQKYPEMTAAQLTELVGQIATQADNAFDDAIAKAESMAAAAATPKASA